MLQENLIVSGGTCSLDASTNDTHVVQIVKHPGKSLCSQLILGAKGLGKAIVTIQDVGLSPKATTYSLVLFFPILLILFILKSTKCLLLHTMFVLVKWSSTSLEPCPCVHALFSISLGIMITLGMYLSSLVQSIFIRLYLINKDVLIFLLVHCISN